MKKHIYAAKFFMALGLLGLISLQSCIKDKIDLSKSGNNSITPQYAGALIYSSLTLKDVMSKTNNGNGQLTTDSTGFITLVYKGNLFSLKASDFIVIPAQTPVADNYNLTATDVLAINSTPTNGMLTISNSSLINFQAGGSTQINTLNCKTATLIIDLAYSIKQNASIKITIPGATLGGVPFTQIIPVTYSGAPVNITQNLVLDGYTIDMTNGGTTHNQLKINYDITITKTTNTSTVGESADFTQTFNNIAYNSIIGYLGQQSLSPIQADTIPITIFKNSTNIFGNGNFTLVNPSIKVFLTNSYGLPIQASFNTFEGYTPGQPTAAITGAPSPLPIPIPLIIGQSKTDSFTMNNSNSNIVGLINHFPKNVIFNVNSQSNPAGPVYSNFVTDTSQFNVDMEVDLPMYGTVTNFMFQDTVAYHFNLQTTNVKAITVRTYISNGFPIDVNMRLAFVDSAYNVIDELITPVNKLVMPSASVDNTTHMVTSPTQSTNDFVIPSSVMPQLNKVKYILIGAIANTINGGTTNVKLYDFYHLDVKLGVNVELYIKF